jgi:DNA invertase Pin-like site-specific DNA recombinase
LAPNLGLHGGDAREESSRVRTVLYARVSTKDQAVENQLQPLREYVAARGFSVAGEYFDVGVSGRKERRPGLDQVMALARARAVDAVIVAGFDRFGRSLPHLVGALEEFQHLGVNFVSLREQIDLGSPAGRVMFAVVAAMAEFERALIKERIQAGLRRAKAQGKRLGRPPRVYHRDRVLPLREAGHSLRRIAKELGVSRRTVQRALRTAQNPLADLCSKGAISQAMPTA